MKLPNLQSIRWKIAIPQLGLFLLILFGVAAFPLRFSAGCVPRDAEDPAQGGVRPARRRNGSPSANRHLPFGLEEYARTTAGSLGLRFTIIECDGTVLGNSEADPAAMENHLARPEVQQALAQGTVRTSAGHSATTGINTLCYVAVPIRSGTGTFGLRPAGDAAFGRGCRRRPPADDPARGDGNRRRAFAGSFVLVARRTTQPLEELTDAARRVAAGDFQTTILPAGRDEIGQLTAAFNTMTGRLRTQFDCCRPSAANRPPCSPRCRTASRYSTGGKDVPAEPWPRGKFWVSARIRRWGGRRRESSATIN